MRPGGIPLGPFFVAVRESWAAFPIHDDSVTLERVRVGWLAAGAHSGRDRLGLAIGGNDFLRLAAAAGLPRRSASAAAQISLGSRVCFTAGREERKSGAPRGRR